MAADNEEGRDSEPREATGKGKSPINVTNIMEPTTHGHFWMWFFILGAALWLANKFNVIRVSFLVIGGIFFLIFIFWGVHIGFSKPNSDHTETFIALALLIWLLDLMPQNTWLIGPFLGPPYAGFEFSKNILLQTNWFGIITSGASLIFWYLTMVYKIIRKEWVNFGFIFFFILITHSLFLKYFPDSVTIPFSIGFSYAPIVLFFLFCIFLGLGYYFDKKAVQTVIPNFFTYLFMITVFSFFLINNGWMHNTRAWMHMIFTLAFGFGYVIKKHELNPLAWHIIIPSILLLDFFGYGLLWSSDYLSLKFIPIIVLIVLVYCYAITEGNNYAIAAFVFLITFVLIMSIQVYGYDASGFGIRDTFKAKQGSDFKQTTSEIGKSVTDFIGGFVEGRLELATGGLYKSQVEQNQFEPLGVFFENVRSAQPKFYRDEPTTIWATVKSRTLSDPVKVDFKCYKTENNERVEQKSAANPLEPFTISTFEETDVECRYPPSSMSPGTNSVALSLKYNFETDAYQKIYLMDLERLRSMARENLNPFDEFGITDKDPAAIYTNGPVEIGVDIANLLTAPTSNVKPQIGILLNNRNKITDKQGKPIGQWEGRIKDITQLVIVTPHYITISLDGTTRESTECSPVPFKEYTTDNCKSSCSDICRETVETEGEITRCSNDCDEQCDSLFKDESGGPDYNGYQLDTTKIRSDTDYKDIDRYKTFSCRLNIDQAVLENIPITTKFIRIKARYIYSIDRKLDVLVEKETILEEKGPEAMVFKTDIPTTVYLDENNANEVKFSPIVYQISEAKNVNYLFVKSIIQQESLWNPDVKRYEPKIDDTSYGLMQVLGGTGKSIGCKSDFDTNPESNIDCGVRYIISLINIETERKIDHDLRNIAAAYNCGPKALNSDPQFGLFWKNLDNCPAGATNSRIYVDEVMGNYDKLLGKSQSAP